MKPVNNRGKIFVFGASGHAKVVIDIIERQQLYEIAFLVDDDPKLKGSEFYGYPVIGGKPELLVAQDQICGGIVAIGINRARITIEKWLTDNRFALITAIHPSAQLARGVTVGEGTVIMAGVIINSDSQIGRNVIVNTLASIDHDCIVGDGVHIAPGTTLCGNVQVGDGSFICSSTTIIPNLLIGESVIVGAGSTVIRDVPDRVLVAGSPAKHIRSQEEP